MRTFIVLGLACSAILFCSCLSLGARPTKAFPYTLTDDARNRELSAAMDRTFHEHSTPHINDNELYTQFKYTKLMGFDYSGGDGTISRRDPTKVLFENGEYYVCYTRRHTPTRPMGPQKCTDTIPSTDWDLSDLWYATSKDGFTWEERDVAVPRPPKPVPGWRSVTTTDILVWEGKYYLYYQCFQEPVGLRIKGCPVAVSSADSPDGPWTRHEPLIIPNGTEDEWDHYSIHDPFPVVYKGKIYLYHKSDFNGRPPNVIRMHGVTIADHPLGPFTKHPLNPVVNSGHETTLFPFKKGMAAFAIRDGNEHFTIQYAKDGVNFEIASIVEMMPDAAGPFVPDAFTNTEYGRGITWGLCHASPESRVKGGLVLMRLDCDLSLDLDDPDMKKHVNRASAEDHYKHGLTKQQHERIFGKK